MTKGTKITTLFDRFWEYVDKKSDDECWNWMGYKNKSGYGRIRSGNSEHEQIFAHKFSLELKTATEIGNDIHVFQKCNNRGCVNPLHLYINLIKNKKNPVTKFRQYQINLLDRFWSRVDKKSDDECWEWMAEKDYHGYGKMRTNGGHSNKMLMHRFSWELHNKKEIPEGTYILHTCDNPACVNPKHLYAGTLKDNMQDKVKRGRCNAPKGENHPSVKLTNQEVINIRKLFSSGKYTLTELGEKFHVGSSNISSIIKRKTWKDLQE